MMAQSEIIIGNKNSENRIIGSENTNKAGLILKSYLEKIFIVPFEISSTDNLQGSDIYLEINERIASNSFLIESNNQDIHIIAPTEKLLRYGIYTLLEYWGFRKFTAAVEYVPEVEFLSFPKNHKQLHSASFEYRAMLYPDAYDEDFRDWHKLDWHLNDFGIWGHSFDRLLPPKENFATHPDFFALYEGKRRAESLCMTNDTVVDLVSKKVSSLIDENPNAQFYSISQNDDVVYCECTECKKLNTEYGGPQGALYYFLNKIALRFPKTKFTTLAYLHTYNPPTDSIIAPNIFTLFSPIELNRGKFLNENQSFKNTLQNWSATTSHLYLWDYTVQFSNYLSPFPNIHTFSQNYKLFKEKNVRGVFVQGYADVPGDFSELRQYLLAKLLWDVNCDTDAVTDDFLRGFYGKAATSIKKYLNLLTENQVQKNQYLDIYSGPVQSRKSFLTPEAMDQYDQLISEAENAVKDQPDLKLRVSKLRLALEYVYFEQSKFYGKDAHGMFVINRKKEKEVRKGLTERVEKFVQHCNEVGIYELSEGGISPDDYLQEWIKISQNTTSHLGENLEVRLLTEPAEDFKGKGSYGLVDGTRGFKDFNINWMGWYGNNPEIEIKTNNLDFNTLNINFLEDQRHWVFTPQKITLFGYSKKWEIIEERILPLLTEKYNNNVNTFIFFHKSFSKFTHIKVIIENQQQLPYWRNRKFKKPMVMIDEIEFQKK
ncbi:MAG: DUF4838 domain-containing protein [Flavobacterium sp.]|nr:MAG: DUF4838 domain-containing protein [Flavobacterium sp.]